jgi:hypothetical protein
LLQNKLVFSEGLKRRDWRGNWIAEMLSSQHQQLTAELTAAVVEKINLFIDETRAQGSALWLQ